jgi:hypothetical protein
MIKQMKIISITIIMTMVLTATVIAVGTTSADFLNISVSARHAALGGANWAISNDIASTYFNPAGLSSLEQPGLNFMHNSWLQDISYEFIGVAFPIKTNSTIGISASYLHMGQVDVYNMYDQQDGSIRPYDLAGIACYSQRLSGSLYLGLSGKYIVEKLADIKASGYALDIGIQYLVNMFTVGFVVNNLGPKIKYDEQSYKLPSSVSVGGAFNPINFPITMMVGVKVAFTGETSFSTGMEYNLGNILNLRTGFGDFGVDNQSNMINFGAGLKLMGGCIDYAFNPGQDLGQTHFFSFTINFGKTRDIDFNKKSLSNNEQKDTPATENNPKI